MLRWLKIWIQICIGFSIEIREDHNIFWNPSPSRFNRLSLVCGTLRVDGYYNVTYFFLQSYLLDVSYNGNLFLSNIFLRLKRIAKNLKTIFRHSKLSMVYFNCWGWTPLLSLDDLYWLAQETERKRTIKTFNLCSSVCL